MGKIFCLMGKSSSGKDTIYKMLLEQKEVPVNEMEWSTFLQMKMA